MEKTKAQLLEDIARLQAKLAEERELRREQEELTQRIKMVQATLILRKYNEENLIADGKFGEETLFAIEQQLDLA